MRGENVRDAVEMEPHSYGHSDRKNKQFLRVREASESYQDAPTLSIHLLWNTPDFLGVTLKLASPDFGCGVFFTHIVEC
jgi:hypothetical protein